MREDNDRERILCNIAAMLASELARLQSHPIVQEHFRRYPDYPSILCDHDFFHKEPLQKGELVVCHTSTGRQQNPFLISFVEANGYKGEPNGAVLRAIGTSDISNYGNESFIRVKGISQKMLWEGQKRQFSVKLSKALKNMDNYFHRFRGLRFASDTEAEVTFGEIWGGLRVRTKPYTLKVKFNKKTTIKNITQQLVEQGFGKREFEPEDGKDDASFGNPQPITRSTLIGALESAGIELKPEIKEAP